MRIVTVGGSVAALTAALLLARRGHDVTLVERDAAELPSGPEDAWSAWSRPGVPHLRQLHIFNARGRQVLRTHLPDVYEAWLGAGAFETPLLADDPEVVRVNSRRTTFEWVLRRAVAAQPGVCLRAGVAVTGLLRDHGQVTGVTTASGGSIAADLVVDASGRHGVTSRWLEGLTTRHGPCGTVAATRWYRVRHGDVPGQQRADLGYAACVLVPTDGGMFSVTFGYQRADEALKPLRTLAGFAAAAAVVEPIARFLDPAGVEPATGVLGRGDAANRLRTVGHAAGGLVLLGDAAVCTNPGYGRGIGLALVHAAGLADTIDETGDETGGGATGDPEAVAQAFERFTSAELEPWYHAAVASDRARRMAAARAIAGEPRSEIGGPGDDPDVRFARRLPEACARDPELNRTFQRTWHLLDTPSGLWGDPAVRAAVDAAPLPEPAGPDHAAMADLLRQSG